MSAPLLAIEDVRWTPRGRPVLRGITFDVEAGETVALIGPTGAGKSSLLRVLGRLTRPDAGAVRFDGRDAWSISPRELARRVALLPQSPEAAADLTVEELVARGRFPHIGTLRGMLGGPAPADRAAVDDALARAGVEALRGARLGELSGGERRRAWIALVLAQEPEVLLLDEPTAFLDIGHQVELLTLLGRLHAEHGTTTVMALHDLAHAAYHATRVLALQEGRLIADGPPAEVLTPELLSRLYGVPVSVLPGPVTGAGGEARATIVVPGLQRPP